MDLESIFDLLLARHREKNNLNSSEGQDILYADFMKDDYEISVIFLTIITIGIVAGIVGNILIIGGVSVSRTLRTTGNVFIVNLAVADLIVVTVVQPFNMIGIIIGPKFFLGKFEVLCHLVATVCVMSCACSMMSLAAISFNRYIFVCKNLIYKTIYTRRKVTLYIIIIWVTVALVDLPNFLRWGAHTFDFKTMGCVFDRSFLPYTMFLSTLIYWIPLALVFACYLGIYLFVRRHRKSFRQQLNKCSSTNEKLLASRQQQDLRMIRTFALVVIIFVLCWVPYFILVLFDREGNASKVLYVIALAIGHCNSSINSILYGATNQRFRTGYKMFLFNYCCKCLPKRHNSVPKANSSAAFIVSKSDISTGNDSNFTDLSAN